VPSTPAEQFGDVVAKQVGDDAGLFA